MLQKELLEGHSACHSELCIGFRIQVLDVVWPLPSVLSNLPAYISCGYWRKASWPRSLVFSSFKGGNANIPGISISRTEGEQWRLGRRISNLWLLEYKSPRCRVTGAGVGTLNLGKNKPRSCWGPWTAVILSKGTPSRRLLAPCTGGGQRQGSDQQRFGEGIPALNGRLDQITSGTFSTPHVSDLYALGERNSHGIAIVDLGSRPSRQHNPHLRQIT